MFPTDFWLMEPYFKSMCQTVNHWANEEQSLKASEFGLFGQWLLLMSAEIIQVSTLTLTTYTHTHTRARWYTHHKRIKCPEAATTIHNTPNDLIEAPSLNPSSRMHRWADAHMQREGRRESETVIWPRCPLVGLCFIKKRKKNPT